jgi:branched-chain amino acid transport system substrate-binding protein
MDQSLGSSSGSKNEGGDQMKRTTFAVALAVAAGFSGTALAQAKEQFVPANFYWVGPYAPGGSGFGGGIIDYMAMINERDGGVNGVKLTWDKCETEYNNARGVECYERQKNKGPTGATVIHPLSTGITYSLIDKSVADKIPLISMGYGRADSSDGRVFPYVFPLITNYWSQNTAKIRFTARKPSRCSTRRRRSTASRSRTSRCRTRATSSSRSGCRSANSVPIG